MPTSFDAGISAAKTTFELAQSAVKLLRGPQVDPQEVLQRLLELQGLILEAQKALGDGEEENRRLKRQIEDLQQQQQTASSLVFADEAYWTREDGGELQGPFCHVCWDANAKLIRLHLVGEGNYDSSPWTGERRLYRCVLHNVEFFLRAEVWKVQKIS